METTRVESLPPPPGVINSIKAGFDAISAHIAVILLPLVVDLFLWLGPRLSMERLFLSIQSDVTAIWRASGVSASDIQNVMEWYQTMIPKLNLFWLLRTLPIGVSRLMFARDFSQTPLGGTSIWQVSAESLVGWVGLLVLLGGIGGGLYFRWVARLSLAVESPVAAETAGASAGQRQAPPPGTSQGDASQEDASQYDLLRPGRAIGQTVLLSIFWSGITLALGLPIYILAAFL